MSVDIMATLDCDEPGCPERIPATAGYVTITAVRKAAAEAGWIVKTRRVIDGERRVDLDFCAQHRLAGGGS